MKLSVKLSIILPLFFCMAVMSEAQPQDAQYKKQNRDRIAAIEDGNPQDAVTYFKEYLRNYPEDLESMYGLAVAYANMNEVDEAMVYVKMAVKNGVPVGRFLAGPKALMEPLLVSDAFTNYIQGRYQRLLHGPMLGRLNHSGASIWVRTYQPAEVMVRVYEKDKPEKKQMFTGSTKVSDDYTGIVEMRGLQAETDYRYDVFVDGSRFFSDGSFRTSAYKGKPQKLKIGFAGGAGYTPWNEHIWDTLRTHRFDAFFHMGDNVYIDHPEHPQVQRYNYYRRQSQPNFRQFVSQTANYAIWDDHDFTFNDGVGGPDVDEPYWKRNVWELFSNQWINPYYGGGKEQPGIWFDVSIGDIDFFFLDGRYYREHPEEYDTPSMLGEHQKQWLKDKLAASQATFKIIASPVPMAEGTKSGNSQDTWDGFPEEREELFSHIEENKIEGVVLVAADRHRSDAWKIERSTGYDFYELMSSKLTNWHTHGVYDESLFGYNQKNSFGVLTFDTTREDPQLTYSIYNIDNELIHQLTLFRSQFEY